MIKNGRRAKEAIATDHELEAFDLIIVDLNLPIVSGAEILRDVSGESGPAVAIFTSSVDDGDVHRTFELGADGYFTKPVDPIEFMELVERLGNTVLNDGRIPRGEFEGMAG